jgi:hypothetical protein
MTGGNKEENETVLRQARISSLLCSRAVIMSAAIGMPASDRRLVSKALQ